MKKLSTAELYKLRIQELRSKHAEFSAADLVESGDITNLRAAADFIRRMQDKGDIKFKRFDGRRYVYTFV